MARATLKEISEAVEAKRPGMVICLNKDDGEETLSVYASNTDDMAPMADIFLDGNTAEFWTDGYRGRKLKSIQDAGKVADELLGYFDELESYRDNGE